MKIDLNLAASQSFRQRHVIAWSLPLLVLSLLLLIRLGFSIKTNWSEYEAVGRSVQREQDRRNEWAARESDLKRQLDQPENRALLREVKFVNSVIDQRQFSFTELEAKVTALLPPEVRLTALNMPDGAGEPLVHVGVEGSSEGPVETFLINLEDSPDFRDTMITGSGFDEKGSGAPVGISCTVHYVTGRGEGGRVKAEAKVAEPAAAGKAGTAKAGPASAQPASPAKNGAPNELTTVPRVKEGLAAARAHPGVPVKIARPPAAQKRLVPNPANPGQQPGQQPGPSAPPGKSAASGPTPK